MNKKGFTLTEILSAIIILGIVLGVGVMAVSRYINDSKERTYITEANKHVDNLIALVTTRDYSFRQTDTTYYVPVKCITKDDVEKTAFGSKPQYAYVVVIYNGRENIYYYTERDLDNKGIELVNRKKLSTNLINHNLTSLNINIGIGGRPNIVIYPDDCSSNVTKTLAVSQLAE